MDTPADHPLVPPPAPRTASRWMQAGVFLVVLFVNLILESRTQPYNDSKYIYAVAENLVYRGAIDIQYPVPGSYGPHPFLVSAIHVPGVALRKLIVDRYPDADRVVKPITSHLGSQLMNALGCLIFFRLLLFLGLSTPTASLGTLFLAFATFLPIYARTAWSEACQAACFTGFLSSLLRLHADPRRKTGLWFGFWTGMLVNAKYIFGLALPGALLFLGYEAWRAKTVRRLLIAGLWSALPGALLGAVIVWYNVARTGSVTGTGYPALDQLSVSVFGESIFVGLWSYFFSFGKSLFLYAPPLLLTVIALPRMFRRHRAWLAAILLPTAPVVLAYCKFAHWSGDWCWGPRYIIFLLPAFMLPAAILLEDLRERRRTIALAGCATLFVVGAWVQIVGGSQYWDIFIRYSKAAQTQWLGQPNRVGALTKGLAACDPCFEDFYARNYTPAFQPIENQAWFLNHHLLGHTFAQAEADFPLRRYTTLPIPSAQEWYTRPHFDWWKIDFDGKFKAVGNGLLAFFILGLLGGAAAWLLPFRRPRPTSTPPSG